MAFVRSHLLVCFYFRLHRDASDVEYAPAFAKVGFDGKIRFDSGPLGNQCRQDTANGHCTSSELAVVVSQSQLTSDNNCPVLGKLLLDRRTVIWATYHLGDRRLGDIFGDKS